MVKDIPHDDDAEDVPAVTSWRRLIPKVLRKPPRPTSEDEHIDLSIALFAFARVILIAVVAATVAIPTITWFVLDQRDAEQARDDQRDIDGQYLNCLRGNELREANITAESQPGQVLDLTQLPSVQAPDVPSWFREITMELKVLSEAASKAEPAPKSKSGQAIIVFRGQIRDCEVEYPTHTPGLRLPHAAPTTTAAPP